MLKKQNDKQGLSLRTADAFPVVASLPPKMRLLFAGLQGLCLLLLLLYEAKKLSWGRKTSQLHENPELT